MFLRFCKLHLNNGCNEAKNCKVLTFGCVLLTAPRLEFAFLNCINFVLSSEALLFYLACDLCFESTVKIERLALGRTGKQKGAGAGKKALISVVVRVALNQHSRSLPVSLS